MDLPFVEVDHSGDIGIEARGKNLSELFENLTRGLFSLMYRGEVAREVERQFNVRSNSMEDLIVDWLSEIIAASSMHGELYGGIRVEKIENNTLDAVMTGEKIDPAKHDLRFEVKAATYHRLLVERRGDFFFARVIFDL